MKNKENADKPTSAIGYRTSPRRLSGNPAQTVRKPARSPSNISIHRDKHHPQPAAYIAQGSAPHLELLDAA
jgi:hypothetical protein